MLQDKIYINNFFSRLYKLSFYVAQVYLNYICHNILIFQTSGQKHWKVWEDEDSPTKFNEINFLRFNRRLLKTGKVLFQSFDMFNDSWSGLDHIFLSNIIHDYSEDKVRSLFKNMKDKKSVFLLEILREENELSAC